MFELIGFLIFVYILFGMFFSTEVTRTTAMFERYDRVRLSDDVVISLLSMYVFWPYFIVRMFQTRNIKGYFS